MIQRLFMIALTVILSATVSGQEKNRRDATGRRQGYWESVDSDGNLIYSGYFKDDKPAGEMKRYYPTGEVRVVMQYDQKNGKVHTRFLWQDGGLAAQGNYTGTKRDSVWLYYSYYTKTITHRSEYAAGVQIGKEQSFYSNGKVAEEINWKNGQKDGPWNQFFDSGQLKMSATYKNNRLEGSYAAYYSDGRKEAEGAYHNDLPDGTWTHYDTDGKTVSSIQYADGQITNLDEVEAAEREFFRKVEEQKDRIKEPTVEDMMREAQENQ